MSCGKVVVAFNLKGNRELIVNGETGFFAKQISADALASCIINALYDLNSTEKIGQNSRMLVENNFTWKKTSEKVVEIYRELVSNGSQT